MTIIVKGDETITKHIMNMILKGVRYDIKAPERIEERAKEQITPSVVEEMVSKLGADYVKDLQMAGEDDYVEVGDMLIFASFYGNTIEILGIVDQDNVYYV